MNARPFFERPDRLEQSRRRLVLVSYHFPPDSTIGARRWEQLAPFVAERHWGLDVITCAPVSGTDLRGLEVLPHGVRVFGVPAVDLGIERLERVAWKAYRASGDLVRRTTRNSPALVPFEREATSLRSDWIDRAALRWRLYTPRGLLRAYWAWLQHAKYGVWTDRAVSVALKIIRPGVHFGVVTSGPPHRTHDAGREVSMRARLPFVMDMRDPWSLSERLHESVASPLWFHLARRYEAAAIGQASLIVANTEAAREALMAAYPGEGCRLLTVMNGSDDYPLPPPRSGHRFTVAYAGTIYLAGYAQSLFRAVARVIEQLGLRPDDIGIDFIGGSTSSQQALMEMAREESIAPFVSTAPGRSHSDALEFLAHASLHVTFPGWDTTTIPAKIFECVRFDAWLLALADPGSATDRLLAGTGADVAAPSDLAAISAVIRKRYEEFRRGKRPVPVVSDDRFSRRTQARLLLDAIESLTTGSRR